MSHPQPTMPQRQFSPQQHSPNQTYQLPPNKRAKLSPGPPSNPASPYANFAASPRATTPAPTPTTLPSPAPPNHANNQPPSTAYNTPYHQTNGRAPSVGMTLTMPSAGTTPVGSPQPTTPNTSNAPYSTAKLAPVPAATAATIMAPSAPPVHTNMGPPAINPAGSFSNDTTRQGTRPTSTKANDSYDMNDLLMGTGIDLDEEAEFLNNMETLGYPHYPPGSRETAYGAGPANQPNQPVDAITQEELAVMAADRAWNEAAARLAKSRSHEIANYLLEPGVVHKRMSDIAHKYGIGLNLEVKQDGSGKYMGRMLQPVDFPKPEIQVSILKGPDGALVQTAGSFLPPESYLVDQIALLSISTKQRVGELICEANRIATTRQTSAHGQIPQDWLDAAVVNPTVNGTQGEGPRTGAESAVSPRTNPLKRSADELSNGLPTPVSETSPVNYLAEALTAAGKDARDAEESRLRKRLKRMEESTAKKDNEGADGQSRAGSVAPGTPGSIAPESGEPSKAPTKKESKKAAKLAEASSTTVNATLGHFAGGKKKKYSWMTSGGPGSGASTPRLSTAGAPGTPGPMANAARKAAQGPLTKPGVTQLGQFHEDSEKGRNIQLRDWVIVLEERGFDPKSLQQAYNILDRSWKTGAENPA
ncbi:hypothetical protein F5Y06DRAFT_254754 [Hypoxylon sp. FL0890]|nr:hypothetical protein F5Y06DRAFT_254754 [Hypoxylon sp. FL0890]